MAVVASHNHKANGKRLDMQFLRPLDWIKSNSAQLGAIIDLDLREFGAKGPAKVVSIKTCPPIKSGPSNVVTGKFIHESDGNLINLRIKGQKEPTTVTANHRYWSADRKEFVEAGHIEPGEQVSTLAGLKQVVSITPRAGNETVYNLEVQGEHVYLVGSLGTLVHNNYKNSKLFKALGAQQKKSIRSLERQISDHQKRLQDFKNNPTVRPGMEGLPKDIIKAQQQQQQQQRIKDLGDEIETFKNNIQKILNGTLKS